MGRDVLVSWRAFAGFTIFLGLPLAVIRSVSPRKKGFLNAFAVEIPIFLVVRPAVGFD
jgi:ZIP family zinc transporter